MASTVGQRLAHRLIKLSCLICGVDLNCRPRVATAVAHASFAASGSVASVALLLAVRLVVFAVTLLFIAGRTVSLVNDFPTMVSTNDLVDVVFELNCFAIFAEAIYSFWTRQQLLRAVLGVRAAGGGGGGERGDVCRYLDEKRALAWAACSVFYVYRNVGVVVRLESAATQTTATIAAATSAAVALADTTGSATSSPARPVDHQASSSGHGRRSVSPTDQLVQVAHYCGVYVWHLQNIVFMLYQQGELVICNRLVEIEHAMCCSALTRRYHHHQRRSQCRRQPPRPPLRCWWLRDLVRRKAEVRRLTRCFNATFKRMLLLLYVKIFSQANRGLVMALRVGDPDSRSAPSLASIIIPCVQLAWLIDMASIGSRIIRQCAKTEWRLMASQQLTHVPTVDLWKQGTQL